ncbi:MAG: beta strand repeat-containing protein [Stenomitos frigidus ULC029]
MSRSASTSRRVPAQGFTPSKTRRLSVQLATVAGTTLSLLISPLWLTAALSQSATYNPALLNALPTAPLTTVGLNELICRGTNLDLQTYGSVLPRDGCNYLTNQSAFYAATPGFFKVNVCSGNPGTPAFTYIGNFLALTGDYTGDLPPAYQASSAAPPANLIGTVDVCLAVNAAFKPPVGFTPRAADSSILVLNSANPALKLGQLRTESVPQDPNNPTYAKQVLPFTYFVYGDFRAGLQVAYQTNPDGTDTAVYGSDYALTDNTNGMALPAAGTVSPLAGNNNSLNAFATYDPQNHPEQRMSVLFSSLSGAVFLGPNKIAGRILALNNSTVSVSAINGQSTITPGSTAGGFVLSRTNGDLSKPLSVNYNIAGTAANGTDYGYLSGIATLPSGQSTLNVPIIASSPSGSTAVPQKDVQIALTTPADNSYIVPSGGAAGQANTFIIPAYNPSTVTFTQGAGGGTLTPGQSQPFTVTRAGGDTTQPLTVNYTTGGTAQQGVDYQPVSGSVTIPASQTTASVPLSAIQKTGSTAAPATTLSLTPASGTGYDATGAAPINYNIPAYTPAAVSVTQPGNGGAIPAGGSVPFTVTRSGDTSQPLTVPYTIGGTATPGTDYSTLPGSITIPAGATSATQNVATPTQNGSTAQPSKTITLSPQSGNGYTVDPNSPAATYNTAAYTPSSVSPAAGSSGSTIPQGTTGGFTITRTGPTTSALPVAYTLGGAAQNGTDYNQLPGSVTIPAGQSSVTVPVTVPAATGSTATPAKDIQVTVNPGSGYAPDSTTPSTTLTIPAYAPSMVDFGSGGNGGPLTPGGSTDGFTVTRSGATTAPLTVGYTVGGSATPGQDYGQLPGSVTIPAGATSAVVPLRAFPQSGTAASPQEDVQITLVPGNGYAPSSTTPAVYTIPAYSPNANGNPAVTVSIPAGQDTILMPGSSTDSFQVTRSGATTAPLPINYTVGGTGTSGTDYAPLSGTVTIPAGATSATVPLSIPSGATVGNTVAIGLTPGTGYDQGSNGSVTYTIGNLASVPSVSVPSIGLGFDPTVPAFVVTRTGGDTTQPLTVPVDFSGTGVPGVDYSNLPTSVTFGAGRTTASVPVRLLPTATTGNTVTASIPAGSGYTVGSGNGTAFTVPAGFNDGSNLAQAPVPAATPTTATAKKSGGGLGGVAGFAAGAAGLGTIALSTGALGGGAAAGAAGAAGALALPGLIAGSVFGTIPQSCSTTGETPLQLAQLLPQLKEAQPNWSAASFGSLPAPAAAGAIKLGNTARAWKAGQPVADIVRVSDTDGTFNLHCLGLAKLASLGQMGMAAKPLSTLNLVADTSIQGLSKTLYLRAKKISDVKGMAEFIASKSGGKVTADQLSALSFADAFKANPALGGLQLGAMPLNQLPGYSDILVGDIPNWKSSTVSQIVGLKNVPFSQFPSQPKPLSALAK